MARQVKRPKPNGQPELRLDPRNANKHSDASLQAVQLSVARLGAGRSIVVDDSGTVVAGEATLRAAQQLGLPTRVIETDGSELVVVRRSDLKPGDPRRTALALADNQTAKLSEFDEEVLVEQLRGLGADQDLLAAVGFSDQELMDLMTPSGVDDAEPPDDFDEKDEDIETAYCCPKCGYRWSGATGGEEGPE